VTQLAISAARQKCRSQLIEFDQTTMANMTAALDAVCKRIPPEKDSHEVRKRIADAMVACAKSGRRTLIDFQTVGSKTLQEINRTPRFHWFGLGLLPDFPPVIS
jgi:hypothetical protein